jgi:hypothetical protein
MAEDAAGPLALAGCGQSEGGWRRDDDGAYSEYGDYGCALLALQPVVLAGDARGRLRSANRSWPFCGSVRGALFDPRHRQDGGGNRKFSPVFLRSVTPRKSVLHPTARIEGGSNRLMKTPSLWVRESGR